MLWVVVFVQDVLTYGHLPSFVLAISRRKTGSVDSLCSVISISGRSLSRLYWSCFSSLPSLLTRLTFWIVAIVLGTFSCNCIFGLTDPEKRDKNLVYVSDHDSISVEHRLLSVVGCNQNADMVFCKV